MNIQKPIESAPLKLSSSPIVSNQQPDSSSQSGAIIFNPSTTNNSHNNINNSSTSLQSYMDSSSFTSVALSPSNLQSNNYSSFAVYKGINVENSSSMSPADRYKSLTDEEFISMFGVSRNIFESYPLWKQNNLRKEKSIF
jgi:hypothetical protein